MGYCKKGQIAIISIFSDIEQKVIEFKNVPVNISKFKQNEYLLKYHHEVASNSSNFQDIYDGSRSIGTFESPSVVGQERFNSDLSIDVLISDNGIITKIPLIRNNVYKSVLSNLVLEKVPSIQKTRFRITSEIKPSTNIDVVVQGDASFEVNCNGCKPGEIRCKQSGYPGYHCCKCSNHLEAIKSISNKLR